MRLNIKRRLLALVLAALLVLPGVLLSPALPVSASSSGLYGTGSADEINIIRLLDMALNRGGMSMSPSTIQAFLDFWWSSVQSDLNACISNVDTSITGTEAFVDALDAALESADHYDRLGQIIKKYVQFVMTLEYKSLSDFKQLLTQQGTFRRFLLSYVTDQDGNIAGTVDNKLAKYQLGKGFVSMVRQAADAYIEEYEGYWLCPTFTYQDLSVSCFDNRDIYNAVVGSLKTISDDQVIGYSGGASHYFYDYTPLSLVGKLRTYDFFISGVFVTSSWVKSYPHVLILDKNNPAIFDLSKFDSNSTSGVVSELRFYDIPFKSTSSSQSLQVFFTKDGRSIKVWKSLDAFKQSSVGLQNIYYTKDYSGFDESKDVGYTFTGTQYNGGYSHDIIQTTIDNSSEVNESTVNNIVNNYITNNYGDGSGSGGGSGSGSSGSGDDWWNVGDGIGAIVKGIAQLLDFLLKLLGDLIGVISEFLVGLLEVLKGLGDVGSSFGDFLGSFFGFLPKEIIDMIVVGIGAVVVAGVIKGFKK